MRSGCCVPPAIPCSLGLQQRHFQRMVNRSVARSGNDETPTGSCIHSAHTMCAPEHHGPGMTEHNFNPWPLQQDACTQFIQLHSACFAPTCRTIFHPAHSTLFHISPTAPHRLNQRHPRGRDALFEHRCAACTVPAANHQHPMRTWRTLPPATASRRFEDHRDHGRRRSHRAGQHHRLVGQHLAGSNDDKKYADSSKRVRAVRDKHAAISGWPR
jgi:hypothetical protein